MKKPFDIDVVVPLLFAHMKQATGKDYQQGFGRGDPYRVLVSTIIGLQTRGPIAHRVSQQLWARAGNPAAIEQLSLAELTGLLRSSGRSERKAQQILDTTRIIRTDHGGIVPNTMAQLVELPGVGQKTANLVLEIGYGQPAMCVDTHVHRINNWWGWIDTKNANQTEAVLRERLPKKYWRGFNPMLVTFGNAVCWPTSPKCSVCPVENWCAQRGVTRKR